MTEVAQQSKARRKEDFVDAFAPVIAEAVASAYKGATSDVQNKLRRVIDVWKDRSIFAAPIQEAIEARILGEPYRTILHQTFVANMLSTELDKARGAPKTSFGGSIFSSSSSIPSELTGLVAPQQNVTKLILSTKAAVNSADQEYNKNTDPQQQIPSAPVYAARLNGLLKTLANAEGAVAQCVKARKELIGALEKLLGENKTALATEEEQLSTLVTRKSTIEQKKQDVEFAIMRGLSDSDQSPHEGGASASPPPEPDRPEVEALTPPSALDEPDFYGNSPIAPQAEPLSPIERPSQSPVVDQQATFQSSAPGIEILSNLASQYQSVPVSLNGSNKRRRVDSAEEFPDLGNDDGIDADVAEMLKKESSAA